MLLLKVASHEHTSLSNELFDLPCVIKESKMIIPQFTIIIWYLKPVGHSTLSYLLLIQASPLQTDPKTLRTMWLSSLGHRENKLTIYKFHTSFQHFRSIHFFNIRELQNMATKPCIFSMVHVLCAVLSCKDFAVTYH